MLFTVEYTSEDVSQRPYLLAQTCMMLYDINGLPLRRIWTFDTETGIGTMKDGSSVQVHHYGWYPPSEHERERILRLLPPNYHHLVYLTEYEAVLVDREGKDTSDGPQS